MFYCHIPFYFYILFFFFFFNDTATTEIYTLSLHDALPIWCPSVCCTRWTGAPRSRLWLPCACRNQWGEIASDSPARRAAAFTIRRNLHRIERSASRDRNIVTAIGRGSGQSIFTMYSTPPG